MPKTKTSKAKPPKLPTRHKTVTAKRTTIKRVKKPSALKAKTSAKSKKTAKKTPLLLRPLKHLRSRGFVKVPTKRLKRQQRKWILPIIFALVFGAIGCYFLVFSKAATDTASCNGPCKSIAGAANASDKYWIMGPDGDVYSVNVPFYGSVPKSGTRLTNAVGMVSTPNQAGYYIYTTTGAVYAYGNASYKGGSPAGVSNVVGFALRPQNDGYWMFGRDGGVFAYGAAPFKNSLPGLNVHVNNVVGGASTNSGNGYWMVGSDGGIFAFGDAGFYGSMGGKALNSPVIAMEPTASGGGYWLVASDGGIFAFGDAGFYGSMGGKALSGSIVGMERTPSGKGYWMLGSDGGVFAFGDAKYAGRVTSTTVAPPKPTTTTTTTTPTPSTTGGLRPISCSNTFEGTLKEGDKGECVRLVKFLVVNAKTRKEVSFVGSVDANNDVYDYSLTDAVRQYQATKGLANRSGTTDAATWKSLRGQSSTPTGSTGGSGGCSSGCGAGNPTSGPTSPTNPTTPPPGRVLNGDLNYCGGVAANAPYIHQGDSGKCVLFIQQALNKFAVCGSLREDSQFGPATFRAVSCFQDNRGIQFPPPRQGLKGYVGPTTWPMLHAAAQAINIVRNAPVANPSAPQVGYLMAGNPAKDSSSFYSFAQYGTRHPGGNPEFTDCSVILHVYDPDGSLAVRMRKDISCSEPLSNYYSPAYGTREHAANMFYNEPGVRVI